VPLGGRRLHGIFGKYFFLSFPSPLALLTVAIQPRLSLLFAFFACSFFPPLAQLSGFPISLFPLSFSWPIFLIPNLWLSPILDFSLSLFDLSFSLLILSLFGFIGSLSFALDSLYLALLVPSLKIT
jgi:hypothetical protein